MFYQTSAFFPVCCQRCEHLQKLSPNLTSVCRKHTLHDQRTKHHHRSDHGLLMLTGKADTKQLCEVEQMTRRFLQSIFRTLQFVVVYLRHRKSSSHKYDTKVKVQLNSSLPQSISFPLIQSFSFLLFPPFLSSYSFLPLTL